ncbi:hypothetical protein BD413DRAFT_244237 [Trametes elegans]|nr:hypothetical protein BD413DRAFT_244237 [Trametes elegans]
MGKRYMASTPWQPLSPTVHDTLTMRQVPLHVPRQCGGPLVCHDKYWPRNRGILRKRIGDRARFRLDVLDDRPHIATNSGGSPPAQVTRVRPAALGARPGRPERRSDGSPPAHPEGVRREKTFWKAAFSMIATKGMSTLAGLSPDVGAEHHSAQGGVRKGARGRGADWRRCESRRQGEARRGEEARMGKARRDYAQPLTSSG